MNSFVIDQLVALVVGEGVQVIVFGVPDDLMGFKDLGLVWLFLRLLDLAEDVLVHDIIIQLGFAFTVESNAMGFAVLGLVPIILWTSRHKFHNVIIVF